MVQFASYLRRVLCKTRLIFPRINGPNNSRRKQLVLWAIQQFCTCITLFSIFLWRPLHDCDVKPPIKGWTWTCEDKFSFLILSWNKIREKNPGKIAYIWLIERFQKDAIKFEKTQIQLFQRRFHCYCRRRCFRFLRTEVIKVEIRQNTDQQIVVCESTPKGVSFK